MERYNLSIDPGPSVCGWVLFDPIDMRVIECGSATPTAEVADMVRNLQTPEGRIFGSISCEMIASYGMAVGKEVFETCVWIGRFIEAAVPGMRVRLVYRQPVKLHLCGSPRAKDPNVAQALKDRFGEVGTKKNPGPLFGISKHAWAALAVAAYSADIPE